LVCLAWYGFDTFNFLKIKKANQAEDEKPKISISIISIFILTITAFWFVSSIYVGYKFKNKILLIAEKSSSNCNYRISNVNHKNNLLTGSGEFLLSVGEHCKPSKDEDLYGGVVKYKINNTITSESLVRYEWEISESENNNNNNNSAFKAHGAGNLDFNGNLKTDITTSELTSYSGDDVFKIEPFTGTIQWNDTEYDINISSPRLISRDKSGPTDIQGITLKANIKKTILGLGNISLTIDKFSMKDSILEGFSLKGDSFETNNRVSSLVSLELKNGVFGEINAHNIVTEISLKDMYVDSFKKITKIYDDTSLQNLTLDEKNQIKMSLKELLSQGATLGLSKFQGMISSGYDQGGVNGNLILSLKPDQTKNKDYINLARNLTSSGKLVFNGNVLDKDQKQFLINSGIAGNSPEGLIATYEYNDSVLMLNGKINDDYPLNDFFKSLEKNINSFFNNSEITSESKNQDITHSEQKNKSEIKDTVTTTDGVNENNSETNNANEKTNNTVNQQGYSESYNKCMESSGGVTVEMNNCINQEYGLQDASLNKVYKEKMALLDNDKKSELKSKQREWIKIRDKECNEKTKNAGAEGGTSEIIILNDCLLEKTTIRVNELIKM
jgi:uncharacterized protein YecT (DUF1311 family)